MVSLASGGAGQDQRPTKTIEHADIPSRLRGIEPREPVLKRDLISLAVYFAKVGFNTGIFIRNPNSPRLVKSLDHERVSRLVAKYNLKMNLDKEFAWISHPDPRLKLRIYHVALTYAGTFISKAAAISPLDFCEERFWKCANNYHFFLKCRKIIAHSSQCGSGQAVRNEHSSSRLLSVAILPLLTLADQTLIKICALSIEIRKGAPDKGRFNHFMRECLRHIHANTLGRAYPTLKSHLRRQFAIGQAERELASFDAHEFLELWALSADKKANLNIEQHVPRSFCNRHLDRIEPDRAKLEADLKLLAGHFCRLNAEQRLLRARKGPSTSGDETSSKLAQRVLEAIKKYDILFSPIIEQFSMKRYEREHKICIDVVARDNLQLFIDTAASSLVHGQDEDDNEEEEEQFWRYANNFAFWQKHSKLAESCTDQDLKCHLAPNRLVACGFYRLLTRNEPKLIELCALRAPTELYNYFKHNILYQIDRALDKRQLEIKQRLRARYMVEAAESQLQPVDRDLFVRLRRLDSDKCFAYTSSAAKASQARGASKLKCADYLKRLEPNEAKLEQELVKLAQYFSRPSSMFLLNNHNKVRAKLKSKRLPDSSADPEVDTFKLAYKYHVIYSRIAHTASSSSLPVRLHRLVNDHLQLFIDTAARAAVCEDGDEIRFWWCANNFSFMFKYSRMALRCMRRNDNDDLVCRIGPGRLVSVGTYRLLTGSEPKLLAISALRAAIERPDRRIARHQFDSFKSSIEAVNKKLRCAEDEAEIQRLRLRYALCQAEKCLQPVDVDLFIERWNKTAPKEQPNQPTSF